ncbi:hypothetical protein GCM10010253_47930 [Streptomyces badius]|uniref:Uncharacterized protein n=1 Tax=Streptomyces badius TaxID=1941 RepID=A0ABQ2TF63_STRBA|nr:hypothetical protein GCM10010253_47930 [Streptomyces badius]
MAIDVMRFGLHRDLRKMRQDFSRATPRSTGARAPARARLRVFSVQVRPCLGGLVRCAAQAITRSAAISKKLNTSTESRHNFLLRSALYRPCGFVERTSGRPVA